MLSVQLLDHLLTLAGEAPAHGGVEFVGSDPVLPSPLRIGEAGAAVIGATALMAARLWQLKTGRTQHVRVEVDAAAAAMRSSRYLQIEGAESRRPAGGGGLGVYRTRDGRWVYFQRLFPHHRQRIFSTVLGCSEQEEAIAAAVQTWDGQALEEAVIAAGASGGMVRSAAEWQAHDQAKALAGLPLMEVMRIGPGAAQRLPDGERPLSGIRVLDLTRVLAGPTCARTLAEHGADVLRVGTPQLPDNEGMLRDTGFGKRSAALDLSTVADAATLRTLIGGADVFCQGYRPGALAARGFSAEEVAKLRPGIVYVSISAFGPAGPWRNRRGFDSVVQAVSGIADEHTSDGRPRFAPANPLDYTAGYLAAFGAIVALGRRAREGGSYHVRVSLALAGQWLGSVPRVSATGVATELPAERLEQLMMVSDTPFGRLRHLAPVARMSETQPHWDKPSVPLDHDAPEWR
jgi:crotonobetainyl-CoA:carnitine CoA-transferase CaiB-like acyl-CoA transferase